MTKLGEELLMQHYLKYSIYITKKIAKMIVNQDYDGAEKMRKKLREVIKEWEVSMIGTDQLYSRLREQISVLFKLVTTMGHDFSNVDELAGILLQLHQNNQK